ncbi:MAG TPA: GNAT family N-acetyltransferase [Gaiellaceae bacterium]|nr:GNAT family N-acetyltransferase [Gaiellaceae bacterium]
MRILGSGPPGSQALEVRIQAATDLDRPRRQLSLHFWKIGPGLIAAKVRRRLWSTHVSISVVRELGQEGSSATSSPELRVEIVDPETFTELAELVSAADGVEYLNTRPIERARQARAGHVSVGRDAAGQLIAFHMVHESHHGPLLEQVAPQMFPALGNEEILTEELYCLPAYRGRGMAPRLLQETGRIFAARGKRRARAILDTTNLAALRTFSRAGYVPSGEERVDMYRFGVWRTAFRPLTPRTRAHWEGMAVQREVQAG